LTTAIQFTNRSRFKASCRALPLVLSTVPPLLLLHRPVRPAGGAALDRRRIIRGIYRARDTLSRLMRAIQSQDDDMR
jgi:hypothetical protein